MNFALDPVVIKHVRDGLLVTTPECLTVRPQALFTVFGTGANPGRRTGRTP